MSKSPPGLRIIIPPDLKAWIEAEAEELGCDAATWLRMLAVDARRHGRKLTFPQYGQPVQRELPLQPMQRNAALHPSAPSVPDDDAWRGPVEDAPAGAEQPEANAAEINAIIERQLANAEADGALTPPPPPTEMFARSPPQAGSDGTRALSRPPSKYGAAAQPAHLRVL